MPIPSALPCPPSCPDPPDMECWCANVTGITRAAASSGAIKIFHIVNVAIWLLLHFIFLLRFPRSLSLSLINIYIVCSIYSSGISFGCSWLPCGSSFCSARRLLILIWCDLSWIWFADFARLLLLLLLLLLLSVFLLQLRLQFWPSGCQLMLHFSLSGPPAPATVVPPPPARGSTFRFAASPFLFPSSLRFSTRCKSQKKENRKREKKEIENFISFRVRWEKLSRHRMWEKLVKKLKNFVLKSNWSRNYRVVRR